MFTGLILGTGRIEALDKRGKETRLAVAAQFDLADIVPGESIAVNGVCLTVEEPGTNRFTAYASAETMGVTNLGRLGRGDVVNLERALAMGDRLGGHMVSGHVDCVAEVGGVEQAGESKVYTLRFPKEHGHFVVPKGSVALDGISLTVNACGPDWLSVNIIPETQRITTIAGWTPGRAVNMETDLIGKYVLKMLGAWKDAGAQGGGTGSISMEFLRGHGF